MMGSGGVDKVPTNSIEFDFNLPTSRLNPSVTTLSNTPMGAERRRHLRIPSDLTLEIALPDGVHNARLRDVSESGICFFLDRNIEEMALLQVSFDLPSDDGIFTVSTTGVVVRSRKISPVVDHFEVALFFNGLDEPAREALRLFVESMQN